MAVAANFIENAGRQLVIKQLEDLEQLRRFESLEQVRQVGRMMVGQQQAQARQLACIVGFVHLGRQPFAWRGHGSLPQSWVTARGN